MDFQIERPPPQRAFVAATRVYTNVKYKKQPWGVVKSFITKNTQSEIEDNFRQLGECVRDVCSYQRPLSLSLSLFLSHFIIFFYLRSDTNASLQRTSDLVAVNHNAAASLKWTL